MDTQPELFTPEPASEPLVAEAATASNGTPARTTIAISLLVHGEAVRFNRGKSNPDGYDFKHLRAGKDIYPYVSSQCFKKYWREALPSDPSPITREKNARGEEKNQAFTSGNPLRYVDDDLFGYMIAGAADDDAAAGDGVAGDGADTEEVVGPEQEDAGLEAVSFSADQLKSDKSWITRLRDGSSLSQYILDKLSDEGRADFDAANPAQGPSEALKQAIVDALNAALEDSALHGEGRFRKNLNAKQKKALEGGVPLEVRRLNLELLQDAFKKELEAKKKRDTTRRTAPIRMHALVAFSGIKTAQDFQTFSRDVALTGKNSILNPNPVGLYSGWLKTRILIEAHRVGKFFIGPNMDLLDDQVTDKGTVQQLVDPYSREGKRVSFVQMDQAERSNRVRAALTALANVNNLQGPASGALHDGSLRPKAFIGAFMNCADSPFDAVWQGGDDLPRLDLARLKAMLLDWEDLFSSKTIYIGVPIELLPDGVDEMRETITEELGRVGFQVLVDTPRRALLKMAEAAGA